MLVAAVLVLGQGQIPCDMLDVSSKCHRTRCRVQEDQLCPELVLLVDDGTGGVAWWNAGKGNEATTRNTHLEARWRGR